MAAGIGLGIAMAYGLPWLPKWFWFLSAGSGFVGWYRVGGAQRFLKPLGLALIVISLGGLRGHQTQAQEQASLLAWGDRRTIAFTGTVATQPRKQYESTVFCLRLKQAEYLGKSYPVIGRLWCRGPQRSGLPQGLLVRVSGSLTQTSCRLADGSWQSASHLRGWDPGWVKNDDGWSNEVLLASARMHRWMNSWLTRNCAPEQAPLLQALVCGDRDNLDPAFYQACCRAGLAHAIALSGTNLTFVVLLWVGLTWLLPVTSRAPIRWIGATLLGLCYLACTEWPVSLARAWIMLAVTALVCMAQRTPDLLNSLGWAALILIFQNPLELFNPGYQLSVLATASLVSSTWGKPGLSGWSARIQQFFRPLCRLFWHVLPLTIYHFNAFTPAGLLSSILALPILQIILTVASLGLGLGLLGVPDWAGCQALLNLLLSCFTQITWWLARLPGGNWWLPSPHGGWILVCMLGVLLGFIKPDKEKIWLVGMVVLLTFGIGWEYWAQRTVGECSLTVFNLPQGECMLLQHGKHKWLLDTGTQKGFANTVLPCLKQAGIQALTGIALSHEDDDHRGGSRLCASAFKVKQAVAPNAQSVALCRDFVADIRILAQGMHWQPGADWHAQVFWPPAGAKLSSNAGSLGLAISLPGNWVLVTVGDAPEECERRFALDLSGPVVYKASHHGAKNANSQTWLGRLQPSLILISPGYANRFGFPNAATLARFRALGCPVLDAAALGGYRLEISRKAGTWRVAKVNLGPRKRLP